MASKTSLKIFTILFLNLAILFFASSFLFAEVPRFINYQGKLTNKSGVPLNGTYTMTFCIYDAETNGNCLWTETQSSVVVNKGIFNVILGSGPDGIPDTGDDIQISASVFYDSQRWLGVTVNTDSEMSPRARFTSVPYTITADNLILSGMIAMFDSGCPSGWSRVSALDGKFLVGGTIYNPTAGGQNSVALTSDNLPAHNHSFTTNSTGEHAHSLFGDKYHYDGSAQGAVGYHGGISPGYAPTTTTGSHSHSGTTNSVGNSQPFDNRPEFASVVLCKKD